MTTTGATGRRWRWLRDVLIPAGQAASEALPLYAIISLLSANAQDKLAIDYFTLAAMMAAAAWATRLTDLLPQAYQVGRVVLAAVTVAGLCIWVHLTLLPDAGWAPGVTLVAIGQPWLIDPARDGQMLFTAWFLAICLWIRGLSIGLKVASAQREAKWFIGGMAVLLALAAILAASPANQAEPFVEHLRSIALWYFFVGLLVLALIHACTLRASGGAAPGASFSWLAAIAIPIAGIPLAGLFLTEGVAPAVRSLMRLGVEVGILLWHVLLWIGYWLLILLRWLASLFSAGSEGTPHVRPGALRPPPPVRLTEMQPSFAVSSFDATVILVIAVFALLTGLLLFLISRRRPSIEDPGTDDERSSVWSWALFISQLRDLWASLVGAWRATPLPPASAGGTASEAEPIGAEDDVRALYRRFLRTAIQLRHARAPSATPVEFGHSVARAVPKRSGDIDTLTDTYDRTRYGLESASAEALAAMRVALTRVEELSSPPDSSH